MTNRKSDTAAQAFAEWLHTKLTARGYDLTGPRSGGKSRFSEDSGLSPSTVGRLLRAEPVTDTDVLARLAAALGVPLGEILVRAGVLSEDELGAVRAPDTGPRRITPEDAAAELGITDPQARRLFISMTETLQRTPRPSDRRGADPQNGAQPK
ncbi:helix-turn-helix domain-containing protein [Actinacidiphila glaucinigra]|uniref:helix-turn-helix domain-containing protein n=1 Tax=Actinacidiphila glaucinigra TaxID=235986 RepID=UPI003D8A5BF1